MKILECEGEGVKEGLIRTGVANGGVIGFRAGRSAETCSRYDMLDDPAVQGKRSDPPTPVTYESSPKPDDQAEWS
jgi:hypothetical protein